MEIGTAFVLIVGFIKKEVINTSFLIIVNRLGV